MRGMIYEWVRNIVFYQIITSIIINLIPNNVYVKYIRFFMGMLFVLIAIQPLLKVMKLADKIDVSYVHEVLEQELEEQDFDLYLED